MAAERIFVLGDFGSRTAAHAAASEHIFDGNLSRRRSTTAHDVGIVEGSRQVERRDVPNPNFTEIRRWNSENRVEAGMNTSRDIDPA